MIDNFSVLKEYVIPRNVLLKLLDTYQNLGRTDIYLEKLGDKKDVITRNCFEKDCYYFLELLKYCGLNLDITDNRLRLLITKGSNPVNSKEKMICGIMNVLNDLKKDSKRQVLNSSDILMYLNYIFHNKVKFDMTQIKERGLTKENERKSSRLAFDQVLDKYINVLNSKSFEPIMLSLMVYLELRMIKPYRLISEEEVDINKIASFLVLYYLFEANGVHSYHITSFFMQMVENLEEIDKAVAVATFNYYESYFKLNDFTILFLDLINESYTELINIVNEAEYLDDASKAYIIEKTIFKMDKMFTKEDIRKLNPYVSDTTIMRVFIKLKNEGVIMPLSKGRNAVWILTIDERDPRRLF